MMPKPKILSGDPLIDKVRTIMYSIQPRPEATNTRKSTFGFPQVECPDCGQWCSAKQGNYNHHWTLVHGTPFWKEKELIKVIRKAGQKA
jgi:hypothetical protein